MNADLEPPRKAGLQSGFQSGILSSCERGNPHLTGFQCGLTAPCEKGVKATHLIKDGTKFWLFTPAIGIG